MSQFASPEQASSEARPAESVDTAPAPEEDAGLTVFDPPPPSPEAQAFAVPGAAKPQRAPRSLRTRTVVALAAGSLLLGAVGGVGGSAAWDEWGSDSESESGSDSEASTLPGAGTGDTVETTELGSVSDVVEAVLPSVVQVAALSGGVEVSTGSGLVIRSDGYILTNNHVVDSSDGEISIMFNDGTVESGTIVGTSVEYDLAVIKVERTDLTPLVLGDSEAMEVGDPVIAIGSPLGLDSTVTTGIVSALDRPVTTGEGEDVAFIAAIQTDAAINPGNSGGPLLNASGEVIGINSAIAALPGATEETGAGSVGLGFAIPSNQARRVAEELIADGEASVPVIGVQIDSNYTGRGVRIADSSELPDGVSGVVEGSPADEAGLKEGDIITAVNGVAVSDPDSAVVRIRAFAPGDTITVTVLVDDVETDFEITLASMDEVDYGTDDEETP